MKKVWFVSCITIVISISLWANALTLIPFNSQRSLALIKRSMTVESLALLENFTTQKTLTYCGIASAVIVLNSTDIVKPLDLSHPPFHYYTQDNFFNNKVKKIISPEKVQREGVTLSELSAALKTFGFNVQLIFANQINLQQFNKILQTAIAKHKFIIVNFQRTELGQEGEGHMSPIAAYDKATDRYLILDVARYKYPGFWVKTLDLWRAVHTLDTTNNQYRGVLIISKII